MKRPRARTSVPSLIGAAASIALAVVLGACTGAGSRSSPLASPSALPAPTSAPSVPSPSPSGPASPSPTAIGHVDSTAEAVALVLASDPRFAGIGPRRPDLIGQSSWYETGETQEGFAVSVRIGWGDCQSGCIESHVWRFGVDRDGTVTLLGETGDKLPEGVTPPGSTGEADLEVVLVAEPVAAWALPSGSAPVTLVFDTGIR